MNSLGTIWNVLLVSLVAGLGTGVGGLIGVFRKPGKRSFGFLMGITAGVMITLSFLELVNEAWELAGWLTATIGFAAGATFMLVVDFFVPHIRFGERETRLLNGGDCPPSEEVEVDHPGRHRHGRQKNKNNITDRGLMMTGVLLAIGITIHNLPEGISVGAGFMHAPRFGIFIALAIMLHNIPEGIAMSLPLCQSGVCKWDAFKVAFFSGLAEPFGALVAVLFLSTFKALIPGTLAFAGGVMVFLTLDELIPAAREHGHQHATAIGIISGAIFVFILSGLLGV